MVYIDNFYTVYGKWRGMNMCHMLADDTTELLLFAEAIGVNLKWVQKPGDPISEHFDVCLSKKKLAVELGAKDITWREAGLMYNKRINVYGRTRRELQTTNEEFHRTASSRH